MLYLESDSSNVLYIGFYIDYDELDFTYELYVNDTSAVHTPHLILYNRWGEIAFETDTYFERMIATKVPDGV